MNKYYLSKRKLKDLKDELKELKTIGMLEVAEDLKNAVEYGDLPENSEYDTAKEKKTVIENRIKKLEEVISEMNLIEEIVQSDFVSIGSTVAVSILGRVNTYRMVGSLEAKPEEGLISNESPLGRVLMHKKAGNTVKISTPSGEVDCDILTIS